MDCYMREIKRHIRQAIEFWDAWIAEDEMATANKSRGSDALKVVQSPD